MSNPQSGILAPVPAAARYLLFQLLPDCDPMPPLQALAAAADGRLTIVGIGHPLLAAVGADIPGMHPFPNDADAKVDVPSTPTAVWLWLRGDDHGELFHRGRKLEKLLAPAFERVSAIDAFCYKDSRDLSGYIDGTENPEGDAARDVALLAGSGAGLDGSSFVAVQQWLHDLDRFQALPADQQDACLGRRASDNQEMDDAPPSAHVKRTAQEDFEPEAFVLRRSMPWTCGADSGLVFVAFGRSFDSFEALLRRMIGADDGITDALFRFTRPLTGAYFWCPPMTADGLDLRALTAASDD